MFSLVVVFGEVLRDIAFKTPGLVVASESAFVQSVPANALVRNANRGPSIPFDFPVSLSSQSFTAKELLTVLESLWAIRVFLV